MLVTAITTWEGTPAALEGVVAGSKAAAPIHESLGAKNPPDAFVCRWRCRLS